MSLTTEALLFIMRSAERNTLSPNDQKPGTTVLAFALTLSAVSDASLELVQQPLRVCFQKLGERPFRGHVNAPSVMLRMSLEVKIPRTTTGAEVKEVAQPSPLGNNPAHTSKCDAQRQARQRTLEALGCL